MFLEIEVTGKNSDKLSYALMKHPGKIFKKENLTAIFPVYSEERSVASIIVDYPEYKLWKETNTLAVESYVTDREYALSTLFCKELKQCFSTCINDGYNGTDEQWKGMQFNVTATLLPFVSNLKEEEIIGLWKHIGYEVELTKHHEQREWLPKRYQVYMLKLTRTCSLSRLFRDILSLIPVIDNYIHYIPDEALIEQLEKYAGEWLETHPLKELIVKRFLRYKKSFTDKFLSDDTEKKALTEEDLEKAINLGEFRNTWFVEQVKKLNPRSVVDAGCGSGRLAEKFVELNILEVIAFDCRSKAIMQARRFCKKATVFFSSMCYIDERLFNKDVFVLSEVIEHMAPFQLRRACEVLFGMYRPNYIIMSTPDRDYNKNWNFDDGQMRHRDHKFEWNKQDACAWANAYAEEYGYEFEWSPIGESYHPKDKEGNILVKTVEAAPTQGLIFKRKNK